MAEHEVSIREINQHICHLIPKHLHGMKNYKHFLLKDTHPNFNYNTSEA